MTRGLDALLKSTLYVVPIFGRTASVHVPPTPVRTVASEVNDAASNRLTNTVTFWSACFVPMTPDNLTECPNTTRDDAVTTVTAAPAVVNTTSAPVVVPALFAAMRRK